MDFTLKKLVIKYCVLESELTIQQEADEILPIVFSTEDSVRTLHQGSGKRIMQNDHQQHQVVSPKNSLNLGGTHKEIGRNLPTRIQ